MTNEELQSKTISFLRFPLIVGVVVLHSHFQEKNVNGVELLGSDLPVYNTISYLFSDIFSRIAVPLFFFISGFLFYYKVVSFTATTYFEKLKKRAKTLLAPYVFWNLLIILMFFLLQSLWPNLMTGNTKLISEYTISDWLWSFWNVHRIQDLDAVGGSPINSQFWFIRDLMIMVLFSPLVYFLVKKLGKFVVIGLGIFWGLLYEFFIGDISTAAVFFFSAGAYFSIHRKNLIQILKPFLRYSLLLYCVLVLIELYFREKVWCDYLHQFGILVGIVLTISLSAHFIESGKWRTNSFLSSSSFFVYAYHGMFLAFLSRVVLMVIQPHSDGVALMLYVLLPVTTISIGLALYYLLIRYFPILTPIITGGK